MKIVRKSIIPVLFISLYFSSDLFSYHNFFFRSANDITSGTLDPARLDGSSVTLQGNIFNIQDKLVKVTTNGFVISTLIDPSYWMDLTNSTQSKLSGGAHFGRAAIGTNVLGGAPVPLEFQRFGIFSSPTDLRAFKVETGFGFSAFTILSTGGSDNGFIGAGTSLPSSRFDVQNGSITVRGTNSGIHVQNGDIVITTTTGSRGIVFQDGTRLETASSIGTPSGWQEFVADNTVKVITPNRIVIATGTIEGGTPTKFLWVPSSGIIRAGMYNLPTEVMGIGSTAFGSNNQAGANFSVVGGGSGNTVNNVNSTISGGLNNTVNGPNSNIAGGNTNTVNCENCSILGGVSNVIGASGQGSTIAGGSANSASGFDSFIAGGVNNVTNANNSFAAGKQAKALHVGSLIWADAQGIDLNSDRTNQFKARALGGFSFMDGNVGIGTTDPTSKLRVDGANVLITSNTTGGAGNFSNSLNMLKVVSDQSVTRLLIDNQSLLGISNLSLVQNFSLGSISRIPEGMELFTSIEPPSNYSNDIFLSPSGYKELTVSTNGVNVQSFLSGFPSKPTSLLDVVNGSVTVRGTGAALGVNGNITSTGTVSADVYKVKNQVAFSSVPFHTIVFPAYDLFGNNTFFYMIPESDIVVTRITAMALDSLGIDPGIKEFVFGDGFGNNISINVNLVMNKGEFVTNTGNVVIPAGNVVSLFYREDTFNEARHSVTIQYRIK